MKKILVAMFFAFSLFFVNNVNAEYNPAIIDPTNRVTAVLDYDGIDSNTQKCKDQNFYFSSDVKSTEAVYSCDFTKDKNGNVTNDGIFNYIIKSYYKKVGNVWVHYKNEQISTNSDNSKDYQINTYQYNATNSSGFNITNGKCNVPAENCGWYIQAKEYVYDWKTDKDEGPFYKPYYSDWYSYSLDPSGNYKMGSRVKYSTKSTDGTYYGYNSKKQLQSVVKYNRYGDLSYSDSRKYHSNGKLRLRTIMNINEYGYATSKKVLTYDTRGRFISQTNYGLYNSRTGGIVKTKVIAKTYYSNNKVKTYKVTNRNWGGTTGIYYKEYRSSGKIKVYKKQNYSKNVAKKLTVYTYNTKGQRKSNKYGSSYRYVITKNGSKIKKAYRGKYNSKGKLTKVKKLKKVSASVKKI